MNQAPNKNFYQQTDTTCPYCGVGCGIRVNKTEENNHTFCHISGIEAHPANNGRLCIKGLKLSETLGLENRLLYPQQQKAGVRSRLSWPEALDMIAIKFSQAVEKYGRDSVAFYVSGQLLTEDYYVANKFMKGFIGSANIDTNSRLCMSSAVSGHKRAFGEDLVPGCYEDFEQADMVVLTGSNTAWCHPVLFRRLREAKEKNPKLFVVVIDPRHTDTCDIADLHLPLLGGTDVALFNGLLYFLYKSGKADQSFIEQHTQGIDSTLEAAAKHANLKALARLCGVQKEPLFEFFQSFANTEKVVTLFSMGVNQSSQGSDKVNSIINCHLYTGRIGKPGMGPFSMTGQPNAMGGREVGGLSNMLAAHMDLDNEIHRKRVQDFWQSPRIADHAGLKAVELFEALEEGKIRALWIMATNPVVSLPDANQAKRALEKCDFVVVSDVSNQTDTGVFADILLPALGWGEKNGTVTNSERCISRQRPFLEAPGEARADWWAITEVAKRFGFAKAFDYQHPVDIFTEHARLSAFENNRERLFNLQGLTQLTQSDYDGLTPIHWPVMKNGEGNKRVLGDKRFSYADGKARFVAVQYRAPVNTPGGEFPLILNTGRIRDQWHTMTRTGFAATLGSHTPEPFVDMNPHDALLAGIREGELVRVISVWGSLVVRAQFSGRMRRKQIFVPIHWNDQNASDARVGALVNPVVDPVSGEPEFKHTPVRVEPFFVQWHGVLLSRCSVKLDALTWWTRIEAKAAIRYELAGRQNWSELPSCAKDLLEQAGKIDEFSNWLEYSDQGSGIYHAALMRENRIEACFYVAPRELLPEREWLASLFAKSRLSYRDCMAILAGAPLGTANDVGATVCSCFKVGKNTIIKAIREQGLTSPQDVTASLKAGGNCGSCLPEIRELVVSCQSE